MFAVVCSCCELLFSCGVVVCGLCSWFVCCCLSLVVAIVAWCALSLRVVVVW